MNMNCKFKVQLWLDYTRNRMIDHAWQGRLEFLIDSPPPSYLLDPRVPRTHSLTFVLSEPSAKRPLLIVPILESAGWAAVT